MRAFLQIFYQDTSTTIRITKATHRRVISDSSRAFVFCNPILQIFYKERHHYAVSLTDPCHVRIVAKKKKSRFQPSVESGMKTVEHNIDKRNKQRFG
jgi:hypothetical protein